MSNENNAEYNSYYTPRDDGDASTERTCAQLLIYTGTNRPSLATELLGMTPTRMVVEGQRGQLNRLGRVPVGKINAWFLSSEDHVDSKDLRRHLDWLTARLQGSGDALRRLQAIEGVRMYVYCPWWSRLGGGGPTLWPEQMRALADLNLECTIDFADYSDEK